ncbi:MAG TPA: chloride channel protein [Acidimicrobiales bacterium]|nr:chloride channel protein [Acidimicrobiales bacterium]
MTASRRLFLLSALAVLIGLIGGVAAYLLIHLIALLTNLAFFHRVDWTLPSFTHLHPSPLIVVVAVTGGLVVGLMAKWAPIIRGHGIPEAMEAVLTRQSRISPRTALAKPVSAAIAIGTGGPFGAEGPIIVTGGAIGSLLGQVVAVSPSERKILLASGAAAGMAATFGAPLASVVLAIELLVFEFSIRALVPLVVAASVAAGMHSAFFGSGPLFAVPQHHFAGLSQLPFYVPLGLACGVLAVIINKGLFRIEDGFRRLPVSQFWWPAIGAVGFASVGLLVPRVLGVGYDQISQVLNDRLALGTLAVLALAKLVAWWVALASGTSGGTLAPILLISGSFGALLGGLASHVPGVHLSPGALALVAMAATFGAATRATFASIVFLFELTRDYNAILPLMLATVIATLVAHTMMRDSIMTEKLTRRGLRVPADYHADIMRTTLVAEVMTTDVETVHVSTSLGQVAKRFQANGHGAYPVVDDDGRCVGIIARGDLLRDGSWTEDSPVGDAASRDVVSVTSIDPVIDALEKMLEEQIEHLPVIDGPRLVGICTRTDILRARRTQWGHEQVEPGWRPRPRRRRLGETPPAD